jgi:hypothetical protein
MLNDASRRKFDVVMAWAIDRMGRSLIDLLNTIQHLEAAGVDLYLDQQNIDTCACRSDGDGRGNQCRCSRLESRETDTTVGPKSKTSVDHPALPVLAQ